MVTLLTHKFRPITPRGSFCRRPKGERALHPSPAAPLRIGVVAQYYPPHVGGLEVVARQVASGLAARGHAVEVLTSAAGAPAGTTVEDVDGAPVVVRRLPVANGLERHGVPFPVFGPALVRHAVGLARRCDVVHLHDMLYLSSWVVALVCRLLRTPYVVTQHVGMVEHPWWVVRAVQALVLRTVGSLVLRGADRVLPISPLIEGWLHARLPGVRTTVLRNGVRRDLFHPADDAERAGLRRRLGLPQDAVLVLHVGRFVPKKGFDVVSAAAAEEYVVVLAGGERPADLPASPQRVFLGELGPADVAAAYRACDVFVCASVGEGPMTPMEALLSGCAVLVNDDPAIRALGLGDGVEELAMSADALRERLRALAADPAALADLRRRAREATAAVPDWAGYLDTFEGVLRDAVSAPTGAGR